MARRVTFKGRLLSDGATKQGTMWRCGVRHSTDGADFEEDAFTKAEWDRLEADPDFVVSAAGEAPQVDPAAAEALRDRMVAVFADLAPSEFTAAGRPKVAAMRKRLPEDVDAMTSDTVDAAWAFYASAQSAALIERVRLVIPTIDGAVIDGDRDARVEAVRAALPEDAKSIDSDVVEEAVAAWLASEPQT